tara:strand:+ start:5688 stop:6035 length:348 start_codon:yes stop_codon:yes gene_type:complete
MEERREDFATSALRACADSGEAAGDSTLYESEGEPVADMMSVEREVGDNWTSRTYQMEILGYQISPDPSLAEAGAARNNLGASSAGSGQHRRRRRMHSDAVTQSMYNLAIYTRPS